MAINVSVKVDSKAVEQMFNDALKKAPDAVDNAIQATLLDIERDAKRLTPVDTGRLRSSIVQEYDRVKKVGTVGANVVYAAVQEFGSPSQGIAPQPYLYPAFNKNKAKVKERIKRALDK